MLKRLYRWMLGWADHSTANWVLGGWSLAEASFFPIPPDAFLIALCLGKPRQSFRFATICSIASIAGGMIGYGIGVFLWDQLGPWFMAHVPGVTQSGFDRIAVLYDEYNFWAVFAAGFSPLPYKLFTIAGGVFGINFPIFVLASAISRSARFFLVAALLQRWGDVAERFIEKHLGWLSILFVVLLVAGFVLLAR